MNKDTKKRIVAYKKALPHMKERVMSIAMLLVLSITMMTSATFAWITLSRSPEVSGLATTIASNGNLEVALSNPDGDAPEASLVGDGGKAVRLSNLTWGNLINLSDPSYGLEAITLRPAMLNTGSLNTVPLYAAEYGADGRIKGTTNEFQFTNYDTKDGVSAFYVPEDGDVDYGVRAISSVTVNTEGEEQTVDKMNKAMNKSYLDARTAFQGLYTNGAYMKSVTQLAGIYLSYREPDPDEDQDCQAYIENLYYMADEFRKAMEAVEQNLLDVANLQHFMYCNQNGKTYTSFKSEDVVSGKMASVLSSEEITVESLSVYMDMHTKFYGTNQNGAYYQLKAIYDEWKIKRDWVGWEELAGVGSVGGPIGVMADIPSTTVNGKAAKEINANTITSLVGHNPNICEVHEGLIKDMDQLLGTQLNVKVDRIDFTLKGISTGAENVQVSTSAEAPWLLAKDNSAATEAASGQLVARNATAADTYGMAVDFWVRTNSSDSLLILEGEYIKDVVDLEDAAGNPLLDINGNQLKEERIVGYGGVNRVWDNDDPDLPEKQGLGTSATQGTGSCYVFYLENPEDRAQSLEMLKAMRVAFVNEQGDLLAIADMDTENVFEEAGRVLVPLLARGRIVTVPQEKKDEEGNIVYQTDSNGELILDSNGNPIPEMEDKEVVSHYITQLNQNEATRITAIIYLDGEELGNSQVLSAGSIKGQLNIQFGTTEDLVSMNDPDLKKEAYILDFNVEEFTGDFDSYNPNNKPVVDVTVTLTGMDAENMRGNFTSMLSTTQGAKQEPFTLECVPGTATYTARVTLNGAGTYQLRSIQIDGVDYAFDIEKILDNQIVIPGTTVNNVECVGWNGSDKFSYMSAEAFYNLEVTVDISGTSPRSVKGVFENKNGQTVMVTFGPDGGNQWRGKGMFATSGEYSMTYMVIDNVRVPLLGVDYKTLDLKLGLRVNVFVSQPLNAEGRKWKELYEAVEDARTLTDEEKTLMAEIIAAAELSDDEKAELTAAVNDNSATAAQRKELLKLVNDRKEDIIDQMNNGDPNDPDDGLQMTTSTAGYSFYYVAGPGMNLYMDVTCVITDDKGGQLRDLPGVQLRYSSGGSNTGMDTDMTWNSKTNKYEGDLELANPGYYTFNHVIVKAGDPEESVITVASDAPYIAANSRDPIAYEGPLMDYKELPDNVIRANAKREMTVVLKDAPSAMVKLIMEYADVDATGKQLQETHELMAVLSASDNENGLYQYTVQVPKDGNWKVVGMKVANVVYYDENGKKFFFDGATDASWADLSEEVRKDNISRSFFTTVVYNVNKQPNSVGYTGQFMEDHFVEGMTVVLTDYLGRPVEGAEVNLMYRWNPVTAPFAVNSNVTYPNAEFKATKQADGITFAMPAQMNFQLAGNYDITFSMKIGNDTYTFADFTMEKDSQSLNTATSIKVQWTDLPQVTISLLSQSGNAFAIDEKSSGKTEDSGDCNNKKTAAAHKDARSHENYASISADKKTATVFIECEKHNEAGDPHDCVPPQVTLNITAMDRVEQASLSFTAGQGVTVHMYETYTTDSLLNDDLITEDRTNSYTWESGSGEVTRYIGQVEGDAPWDSLISGGDTYSDKKVAAGTLRSDYLTLTYNGVAYKIAYTGITINNPM